MCGIAGIISRNKVLVRGSRLERMSSVIAHRGPNGDGVLLRGNVGLANRRLAIIDLEKSTQPISNEDESVWVTYNGEIYNYLDLRNELRQKGHVFSSRGDTEVIVHAYEEWGVDCVRKFRGMFAFGLVDLRRRCLLLARDHFGIKPLYYRIGDGYIAFASEIAALREEEDRPPTGNLQAVDFYLRFQYIPTPHTIYQEIFKLPPASFLKIDFDGHREGPVKYWDLCFRPDEGLTDGEWEERVEAVIQESVKAHLVADVPFGVLASGGIDSTLVASSMSRILQHPVKAFAIGFEEKDYSELQYAEEVSKRYGIELYTDIIRPDALSVLPDLIAHYGEPFGDSSALATWWVSRLARTEVPMVLSGDGGDEAFGGYDSYARWMGIGVWAATGHLMRSSPHLAVRAVVQALQRRLIHGGQNQLTEWQTQIIYCAEHSRRSLWRSDYQKLIGEPCDLFEEADKRARDLERLSYSQYLDYQTYLPCDILTKVDVASMYHGLEVRTPLVDLRVVELAGRLPLSQRLRQTGKGEVIGKYLLKRILGKTFSNEFVYRRKSGFAIPRALWFLPGTPGRKLLEQILLDLHSPLHQWFNAGQIRAHLAAHNHRHDNSGVLWLLFVLGIWLQQNPDVKFAK